MIPRIGGPWLLGAWILGMAGSITLGQPITGPSEGPTGAEGTADSSLSGRVIPLPDGLVDNEPIRFFPGHAARVGAIAFFPDGDRLLSVSNDGMLCVWAVENGKPLQRVKVVESRGEAALAPDGRFVAVSAGPSVVILDIKDEKSEPIPVRELERADLGFIGKLAFSPDGHQLASANYDHTALLWDVESGRVVQRYVGHRDQVRAVAFHPSGNRIVTAGYDRTIRVWDRDSGKALRVLEGHDKPILAVAISPDGTRILSGGFDQVARLWDFETGRELRSFRGHADAISGVAFSPDGRLALSGGYDHTVRLWDVHSGEELQRFVGHTDYVLNAIFSPDGRFIASSSGGDVDEQGLWVPGEDYAIRLWRVPRFDARESD